MPGKRVRGLQAAQRDRRGEVDGQIDFNAIGTKHTLEASLFYYDVRDVLSQNEELFGPWSGVIFRSVSPRYARPNDILSGYGSYESGGRWNAPGVTRSTGVWNPVWRLTSPLTSYCSTSAGRTEMYHHAC